MGETVFATEEQLSRAEAVERLRMIADKLEEGELVLSAGDQSVEIAPGDSVEFETEVEQGRSEMALELELEWRTDADSGLEIQ